MKRIIFFVLAFCVLLPKNLCANDQEYWEAALTLHERGQYVEAIEEYQRITDWTERPDVLYNLGVSAMASTQIGEAILFFEKAYRLDPSDVQIRHNLEAARQRIENPYAQNTHFLQAAGLYLFALMHPNVWIILLLVLAFTSGWLWLHYRKKKKRAFAWLIWISTSILALLFFSASLYLNTEHYGVALKSSNHIYANPQCTDTLERSVPEGTKVRILNEDSRAIFFRLPNGVEAYLPIAFIERI